MATDSMTPVERAIELATKKETLCDCELSHNGMGVMGRVCDCPHLQSEAEAVASAFCERNSVPHDDGKFCADLESTLIEFASSQLREAAARIEALEAALRFYADTTNWQTAYWEDGTHTDAAIPITCEPDGGTPCDCGDIARAALKQD
jgi:hypothetical protein